MTRIEAPHITTTMCRQTEETAKLDDAITANLKELGYGE
jgi:hypothetical protein